MASERIQRRIDILLDEADEAFAQRDWETVLGEPVAWRGPIVMNTQEELRATFGEYQDGTFLRHARS